jgi:hypothetical protein
VRTAVIQKTIKDSFTRKPLLPIALGLGALLLAILAVDSRAVFTSRVARTHVTVDGVDYGYFEVSLKAI